jgi:hypothetical protein
MIKSNFFTIISQKQFLTIRRENNEHLTPHLLKLRYIYVNILIIIFIQIT